METLKARLPLKGKVSLETFENLVINKIKG